MIKKIKTRSFVKRDDEREREGSVTKMRKRERESKRRREKERSREVARMGLVFRSLSEKL